MSATEFHESQPHPPATVESLEDRLLSTESCSSEVNIDADTLAYFDRLMERYAGGPPASAIQSEPPLASDGNRSIDSDGAPLLDVCSSVDQQLEAAQFALQAMEGSRVRETRSQLTDLRDVANDHSRIMLARYRQVQRRAQARTYQAIAGGLLGVAALSSWLANGVLSVPGLTCVMSAALCLCFLVGSIALLRSRPPVIEGLCSQ
jgi:hypothetical protein